MKAVILYYMSTLLLILELEMLHLFSLVFIKGFSILWGKIILNTETDFSFKF